jgi:hypothetical protein
MSRLVERMRAVAAEGRWRCAALGVLLSAGAAHAVAQAPPGLAGAALPNCVGPGRVEWNAGDESAFLDEGDRAALSATMLGRYPMLGADTFASAGIVMSRKAGGDWIYVALASKGTGATDRCVAATFTAKVFDITPALLRKYFFSRAADT